MQVPEVKDQKRFSNFSKTERVGARFRRQKLYFWLYLALFEGEVGL